MSTTVAEFCDPEKYKHPVISVPLAVRLARFWYDQAAWSEATFGPATVRGAVGALKHLKKEVEETLEHPRDLEEYADMMHLIFDACRRAGFTLDQLVDECYRKLEINKSRQWGKVIPGEPCEHVR